MPNGQGPVDEYRKTLDSIDQMRERLQDMGISRKQYDDTRIQVIHVDDKYGNLIITKKLLEDLDNSLQVHSYRSPSDALNNIDESTDLVLVGLHMNEIDGITLTQTIKQSYNVPVVIYSGAPFKDYVTEALAAGVDDVCKLELDPYHLWVLAKRILNLVSRKSTQRTGKLYQSAYQRF